MGPTGTGMEMSIKGIGTKGKVELGGGGMKTIKEGVGGLRGC